MKKSALLAGALMFASLPALSQEAPRSEDRKSPAIERGAEPDQRGGLADGELRDRMADAIETVEDACAADIDFFFWRRRQKFAVGFRLASWREYSALKQQSFRRSKVRRPTPNLSNHSIQFACTSKRPPATNEPHVAS